MKIAVRTDASAQIGTGHVARCQTLADALKARGADVTFYCRHLTDGMETRLTEAGHGVKRFKGGGTPDDLPHAAWLDGDQETDASEFVEHVSNASPDWLIVDHYALDARWEKRVRRRVGNLLVIDDLADRDHDCDLLLDQNLWPDTATRYDSRLPARTRRLLGPRYCLLRPEFSRTPRHERDGRVRRILVFFGGVDAHNQTGRVLALLPRAFPLGIAVDVVIGAAHPARDSIVAQCAESGHTLHIQADRMAELIASADLSLGTGGTALWERCCGGLPTLAWPTAFNQRAQLECAAAAGLLHAPEGATHSDEIILRHLLALQESPHWLIGLSKAGLDLVDGRGTERVCREMGCTRIRIRPAAKADSAMLFEWRNSETVRRVSRDKQPIAFETHTTWLESTLARNDRKLTIGELDGAPVGVVRFDIKGDEAEVSIYLGPDETRAGLGGELLVAAEHWLMAQAEGTRRFRAEVLDDNSKSRQMFLANGYRFERTILTKGVITDD
ncbi:UDP-2,4-diacetamido-2,4,6-trideoxy-beta-L-altropyranose hydrolase [Denitromonas ohlonensis]|uniref:UDP-2,4-diacetamido-2,4, 6-trideoxy-beta-L-altropyranose hydrolase n=2 Tax=Denitromonas TaxID=139331 RepID=A0A557R525_9RHOO|nr:UDP-2,4-diacetamido-2,4,6-trideoxy-beta-L-altropyranose hydrolase [Denitromonas ohlonensis]TVO60263.1 UDP-2,4-diacetamido-2,4,6-trideoxy-beta-L-altropyranose hydrolase [Denitromonas ohlonensis]TVO75758.1 UDP-2,4-diacetamido-2,4,6-trideoxy-beta-L-altropyranose hydrolase [Denitromonas ohlonensis]